MRYDEPSEVHARFLRQNALNANAHPAALAPWLLGVQPPGVEVRGNIGVSIEIPPLNGTTAYAPPEGTLVVMIGYDGANETLVPAGVGEVSNGRVESVGELRLSRLDYLGYTFVGDDKQSLLTQYRDGRISYQQWLGALTQATPGTSQ